MSRLNRIDDMVHDTIYEIENEAIEAYNNGEDVSHLKTEALVVADYIRTWDFRCGELVDKITAMIDGKYEGEPCDT